MDIKQGLTRKTILILIVISIISLVAIIGIGAWRYLKNLKQSISNNSDTTILLEKKENVIDSKSANISSEEVESQSWSLLLQKINNSSFFEREVIKQALSFGADIGSLSVGILKDNSCFWGQARNPYPPELDMPVGHAFLGNCYTTYGEKVYYDGELMESADKQTFNLLSSDNYTRDKNRIYYNGEPIDTVDPTTFTIINWTYSKDKNFVYYRDEDLSSPSSFPFDVLKIIEKADPNTFEVFEGYVKDKNHIYLGDQIVKGADVLTFQKVGIRNYKDKNQVYNYLVPAKEIDPLTFEEIQRGGGFYTKDKNHVYYLFKVINDADPETFELLGKRNVWMGVYARDIRYVYYELKKLENADRKSFIVLPDDKYAKDKNYVYYRGKIVKEADPITFETLEILESGYIGYFGVDSKDKNYVYYDGIIVPVINPANCSLQNLKGCKK